MSASPRAARLSPPRRAACLHLSLTTRTPHAVEHSLPCLTRLLLPLSPPPPPLPPPPRPGSRARRRRSSPPPRPPRRRTSPRRVTSARPKSSSRSPKRPRSARLSCWERVLVLEVSLLLLTPASFAQDQGRRERGGQAQGGCPQGGRKGRRGGGRGRDGRVGPPRPVQHHPGRKEDPCVPFSCCL